MKGLTLMDICIALLSSFNRTGRTISEKKDSSFFDGHLLTKKSKKNEQR